MTGVALRTTEDDVRIAVATSDNEHEWQQETWTSQELADFVGKEVTIDIHDTRHGAWGWFSVDDFEVRFSLVLVEAGFRGDGRDGTRDAVRENLFLVRGALPW